MLDNDRPRSVRVRKAMNGEAHLWLAGRLLKQGDAVALEKGRYPLLLKVKFARFDLFAAAWLVGNQPAMLEYGTGNPQWHRDFYRSGDWAMGLGIASPAHQPGVQWIYDRLWGLGGDKTFDIVLPHHAIFAMASYDFDQPVGADPNEHLPRTLIDREAGFAAFRNRWKDNDDLTACIYFKGRRFSGHWSQPDAGSFRIAGLGGRWAVQGGDKKVVDRGDENVVVFADTADWLGGRLIHHKTSDDGSGTVSGVFPNVVLRFVKAGQPPPEGGKVVRETGKGRYCDVGNVWRRSFAVDYCGKCGAPGLFVVADRIKSRAPAEWRMNCGEKSIRLDGKRFIITAANGATMAGTFVAPSEATIRVRDRVISATGEGDFLVVMTVQRGDPPTVACSGQGLDAKLRIGGQSIRLHSGQVIPGQ